MRPILLIGEAPASDPSKTNLHLCLALAALGSRPRPGAALELRRRDPGLTRWVLDTEHVNLLPFWPGYDRRGSAFPLSEARPRAQEMAAREVDRDVVLLAGRRVAAAFGLHMHHEGLCYFEELSFPGWFGGAPVYVAPHPSGVNRWWNDRANRARARDALVRLALEGRA